VKLAHKIFSTGSDAVDDFPGFASARNNEYGGPEYVGLPIAFAYCNGVPWSYCHARQRLRACRGINRLQVQQNPQRFGQLAGIDAALTVTPNRG
jgi:hypothetical protein